MILQTKLLTILFPLLAALAIIAGFIINAQRTQAEYQKPMTVQQKHALPQHWAKAIKEYKQ